MPRRKQPISAESKQPKDQSICWDCAHSTEIGTCPWATEFKPVDGWWARPRKIRFVQTNSDGSKTQVISDSYTVIMCPLFCRDAFRAGVTENPNAPKKNIIKDATDTDIRALAAAIIRQSVVDWERLDHGRLAKIVTTENQTIKSDQLIEFFNSGYFEHLLSEVSGIHPSRFRKFLEIPQC